VILIIDNYDSFVYNLFQAFRGLGRQAMVVRNDRIGMDGIRRLAPEAIVLSPGPGNPENPDDFGVCSDILEEAGGTPILGVCLGHQGIISHFGGRIAKAEPMHGKTSMIEHDGKGVFRGLPSPLSVMRYHSLAGTSIPDCLEVSATCPADSVVMAVRHRSLPIHGVQFHPESIMTQDGLGMLGNFLEACL
jgi:anthranilate synthase/aminodeoxychorismate synthase-like glutamine amidotransferase